MKLYYHPISPLVRKVLIRAHENGLADHVARMTADTLDAALSHIDTRLPDEGWRRGHSTLAEWLATVERRPSLLETAPVSAT